MLEDGEIQRHVRRIRREYGARRDVLVAALRDHLGERVTFAVPAGGIALWIRANAVDVDAWARSARDKGVIFVTAAAYALDGRPRPFMRLGFASLQGRELQEGVRRLAAAYPR